MARRHPALIALVLLFALFLAAAPFFYGIEKSPYTEAVTLYDDLCRAIESGDAGSFSKALSGRIMLTSGKSDAAVLMSSLKCVDRQSSTITFDTVPGRAWGDDRAYTLTISPDSGGDAVIMRLEMQNEVLKWVPPQPLQSRCTDRRRVYSRDPQVLGGAIYAAYGAALKGDTPEAFADFASAFKTGVDREQMKRFLWPAVLRHVSKYTASLTDPSFEICSVKDQDMGRVKVFVKSNDTKKSDPPVVMVREDGLWKIEVMTP